MTILDTVMNAMGDDGINAIASKFGVPEDKAKAVMAQLVSGLGSGMRDNASQSGGLDGLLGAIGSGGHAKYLQDAGWLGDESAVGEGNAILGHVLGSKEKSRGLAQQVAGNTGVDENTIKEMLPNIANVVMGALGQKASGDGGTGGLDLASLSSMLDSDGDGSITDDLLDIAKGFLGDGKK